MDNIINTLINEINMELVCVEFQTVSGDLKKNEFSVIQGECQITKHFSLL